VRVVERRGCDLNPVDVGTEHGRLALQSYVFPDQLVRMDMLRRALEVAATMPVSVDRASADTWVAAQLAEPAPGVATVVFHSIFWPYPPQAVRDAIEATIRAAGAAATAAAPLAWLRYEEGEEVGVVELRLTLWPDGSEVLLGVGNYHLHPVRWLATSA
jgi:hypothetical protein